MNKKQNMEYLTPEVSIQQMEQNGILCSSVGYGTGTTDNFIVGEDITDNF
jgi:hypothetical protein